MGVLMKCTVLYVQLSNVHKIDSLFYWAILYVLSRRLFFLVTVFRSFWSPEDVEDAVMPLSKALFT